MGETHDDGRSLRWLREHPEHMHERALDRVMRADARRNRARVMEAVWRILASKSPDELSMEEVAREADIGKGTLYRHYPTKECLFKALVDEGAEYIAAWMRERIPPEADALTKLRALITLVYDAYEEHPLSVDLLLSYRLSDAGSGSYEHPVSILIQRLRGILEQGMREGLFRPLDLTYTASAVFSLINPLTFIKQQHKLGYTRAEIEERVNDLIWHALKADTAVAPPRHAGDDQL